MKKNITRKSRVVLTTALMEEIWSHWVRFKVSRKDLAKTQKIKIIAELVDCSTATVTRVINAFTACESGEVITHDVLNYPNKLMVEYANRRFATPNILSSNDSKDSSSSKSDIQILAESIQNLANAINKQNEYMSVFDSLVHKNS